MEQDISFKRVIATIAFYIALHYFTAPTGGYLFGVQMPVPMTWHIIHGLALVVIGAAVLTAVDKRDKMSVVDVLRYLPPLLSLEQLKKFFPDAWNPFSTSSSSSNCCNTKLESLAGEIKELRKSLPVSAVPVVGTAA
jgi:hypothetical protein